MPHITRIIDWMNNYAGVPPEDLEQARILGEAVHIATELDDNDDLVEESVHEAVRPSLDAWRRFRTDTGFVPELVEQRVESVRHWFAGRLDRVGPLYLSNRRAVIEIKNTSKIMPANGPQTAAQKQCLIEMGFPNAVSLVRFSVQLCPDKEPPYRMQEHTDPQDFNIFLCSLQMHNWRVNNGYKR